MKQRRNMSIIMGVLLILVGIIGGTIAYFTSSDRFTNVFSTKPYVMEVREVFESPDAWVPGTTTSKTVVATNKGDVPAAVRVKLTESWVDANNNPLPLKDNNNVQAAIINFNNTNWEKSGDYYYYKTKLAKNASTTSLIQSVTFNPAVTIETEHNCTTNDTTHETVCKTSTVGYGGGKYTLIIDVETVQYDQYRTAWNTNVTIN